MSKTYVYHVTVKAMQITAMTSPAFVKTVGTTVQGISVKCVKMATCWSPAWMDATFAGPVPALSLTPPITLQCTVTEEAPLCGASAKRATLDKSVRGVLQVTMATQWQSVVPVRGVTVMATRTLT